MIHSRLHYAWVVTAITFFAVLIGVAVRSAAPLLITPFEAEFGWSRSALATVIGLNLFLFGAIAPVAGKLIDRFGSRWVITASLLLLSAGLAGTLFMSELWHLFLYWGVLVGIGAGCLGSVLSATTANRWFAARRGLALGILNSAGSTGQLLFIPFLMMLIITLGWRTGMLVMLVVIMAIVPVVAVWMRSSPEEIGLTPYSTTLLEGGVVKAPPPVAMQQVVQSPIFWVLAAAFFMCGATSAGLVGTHLIPLTHDLGIPEVSAATTVGIMGGMNFIGSLLSGWLTDRINPRKILAVAFALRGLSLFALPFVRNSTDLFLFGIIYGLDWFAPVAPIIAITADTFGKHSVGMVFGWIFLSHQIGSSMASIGGGILRDWLGNYQVAFLVGGLLAMTGALLGLLVPNRKEITKPIEIVHLQA